MLEKYDDFWPDPTLPSLEDSLSSFARDQFDTTQAVILDSKGNVFLFTGNPRNHSQIVKEWLTFPLDQHARPAKGINTMLKLWTHDGIERHVVFNYEREYKITEIGTIVLQEVG